MNHPLLWDRQRQPKPAFDEVAKVLIGERRTTRRRTVCDERCGFSFSGSCCRWRRPRRKRAATSPARFVTTQGVVPGASVTITNVDTQRQPEPRDQRLRLLRGAAAQPGQLRSHRPDAGLQVRDAQQHRARRRAAGDRAVHARGRRRSREEIVVSGGDAAARYHLGLLGARTSTRRLVESLPMFSNMPITLSRFSPGVNVNDAQTQVSQGYVDNTSLSAGSAARPAAGRHAEPARPRRSAATTTRSTAPTTTAATGASPRRPTPT